MVQPTSKGKGAGLIDRSSPMPAYQQIATSLIARIGQGEWSIGDKIPSENELAADYGVSRVTMRQALSQLEREALIKKYQGRGIFVCASPTLVTAELPLPVPNPNKPSIPSKVLTLEECGANLYAASKLAVEKNTPLIYLQRLFFQGQEKAIGINNVWLVQERFPDLVQTGLYQGSISKTLAKRGYDVVAIQNNIKAIKLDAPHAQLLGAAYDSAALQIDSVHLLQGESPIEFSSTIWVGDSTRFSVTVNK